MPIPMAACVVAVENLGALSSFLVLATIFDDTFFPVVNKSWSGMAFSRSGVAVSLTATTGSLLT